MLDADDPTNPIPKNIGLWFWGCALGIGAIVWLNHSCEADVRERQECVSRGGRIEEHSSSVPIITCMPKGACTTTYTPVTSWQCR